MCNKLRRTAFSLLFGLLFTGALAFGQITGDLQINVSDQSNAAVPNAAVSVRNVNNGATRNTATDSTGQIRVSQLEPGRQHQPQCIQSVRSDHVRVLFGNRYEFAPRGLDGTLDVVEIP